ncbi:MAG: hypothetical protein HYW00_02120, partial [Candidatus Colwellbacteria bacterium]|nr:hypothetical protein [Candidatus Colwellbacteria bacterium]
ELVMKVLGKEYPLISTTKNIVVNPSPLAFRVGLGNAKETVDLGEELTYFLQYKNNASVPLEDVVISARISGEMFDMSTLETNGAADLLTNTLIWSPVQIKELEILEPGEEGQVSFSIKVRDSYPTGKRSSGNLTLKVNARIESPTVPPPLAINKTVNLSKSEIRVAGNISIEASAYFRDTQAKIVNTGPFPPKAGVPTRFTVHWDLSSLTPNQREVEVKAKLEKGVSFTGKVKSNVDARPQFNADTGEVIWKVGNLQGETPQAVFQIEAIPDTSMVGQYMPLLGTTDLKAKDNLTGEELRDFAPPLTTRLEKDPTVQPADGLVRQ